jgi:hypothetical protein
MAIENTLASVLVSFISGCIIILCVGIFCLVIKQVDERPLEHAIMVH